MHREVRAAEIRGGGGGRGSNVREMAFSQINEGCGSLVSKKEGWRGMTGETRKEEEEEYPAASCGCRRGHMRQRESVIRERLIKIESMKMCFFFTMLEL